MDTRKKIIIFFGLLFFAGVAFLGEKYLSNVEIPIIGWIIFIVVGGLAAYVIGTYRKRESIIFKKLSVNLSKTSIMTIIAYLFLLNSVFPLFILILGIKFKGKIERENYLFCIIAALMCFIIGVSILVVTKRVKKNKNTRNLDG